MSDQSLKSKVAKGAIWTLLEKLATQVVQFVVGEKPGRESPAEFIYYNGVGLPFIDIAIGKWAFDKVVALGLGQDVQLQDKSMFE